MEFMTESIENIQEIFLKYMCIYRNIIRNIPNYTCDLEQSSKIQSQI